MLKHICKTLLILGCALVKAQPVYFSKAYHKINNTYDIGAGTVEYNNAYYTIGQTRTNAGLYYFLLKTDLNGDTLFTKFIGKSNRGNYVGTNIITTQDNNLAFCGIESLDTLNFSIDSCVGILIKTNLNGDTLWTKKYGYLTNDQNLIYRCQKTNDNGFIIVGVTKTIIYSAWAIKTDSLGNIQWQYTYAGNNEFFDVEQTFDGGYVFSGSSSSGNGDIYVVKTNSSGILQWQKNLGTPNKDNRFSYAHQNSDSNYFITGSVDTSIAIGYQGKGYIAKLRENGSLIWEKTYNGVNASYLTGLNSKAIEVSLNNFIIMGSKTLLSNPDPANCWLVNIDSSGSFLWERVYNYYAGNDYDTYACDIMKTSDKGFLLTGSVGSLNAPGGQELWLMKIDSLGCDTIDCSLGLIPLKGEHGIFSVYPNPFTNFATIEYSVPKKYLKAEILVYDLLGNKLLALDILPKYSGEYRFENSFLKKGIYIFNMVIEGVIIDSKKVVIIE
jgi:hypothetical protein